MVKGLRKTLGDKAEIEDVEKIMSVLDSDKSGDIDELEWVNNMRKLPNLYKALDADLDKEFGVLASFRTPEDQLAKGLVVGCCCCCSCCRCCCCCCCYFKTENQLAKCMGNIQRLKRELSANQAERKALGLPILTEERKVAIEDQLRSRKALCKKWRALGISPSPGYCRSHQEALTGEDGACRESPDSFHGIKVRHRGHGHIHEGLGRGHVRCRLRALVDEQLGEVPQALQGLGGGHRSGLRSLELLPLPRGPAGQVHGQHPAPQAGVGRQPGGAQGARPLELTEERKAAIHAEFRSRKDLCKKFRAQGVVPSPGYCVFNQVDVDKKRVLARSKLERVLVVIKGAFGAKYSIKDLDTIMERLDKDKSGDISEHERVLNVKACPNFYKALEEDLDPDFGVLNSFRTPEDQLAKCMGNLARLKAELDAGPADDRKAAIEAELLSRKELCRKFRAHGVKPSPGYCVVNQIDTEKKRVLTKEKVGEVVTALKAALGVEIEDVDAIMQKVDKGATGMITDHGWVLNLKGCPLFLKALEADLDPDYGILKCMPGDKI
ncbi:unnamed protein product [Polarella glacialis]|uniref:EF-hand domain-containing protein n=1 Tax=Polarella glacialis TaxID=89957 RepID=A0A813GKZ6_POLGL|nr:unnamed protein product [Polarella glacialis]